MEKTIITWNVPNIVSVWLMLLVGLLGIAVLSQLGMKFWPGASGPANNSGGY